MIKPKRRTKDMVLCAECKKPIHIDDFAGVTPEGIWHKECLFRIFYKNKDGFLTGLEYKIKKTKL